MAQIRSISDVRSTAELEEIAVPEWGDESTTVYVRALTAREVDNYQLGLMNQPKNERPHVTLARLRHANAKLVVMGACDELGEPIFGDSDVSRLADQSNKGLAKVAEAIQRLSGLGDFAESAEALEGKSETARSSDFTSE